MSRSSHKLQRNAACRLAAIANCGHCIADQNTTSGIHGSRQQLSLRVQWDPHKVLAWLPEKRHKLPKMQGHISMLARVTGQGSGASATFATCLLQCCLHCCCRAWWASVVLHA
jgi:hypothetical protein